MTDYLEIPGLDWSDPAQVSLFDEVPLWSALFGTVLLDRVPLRHDAVLLDLACGAGFPLLELAQRLGPTCRAYGLDCWLGALERVQEKVQRASIRGVLPLGGDGVALPFPAACVDLLTINLGLNNFADPGAVLAECARVLRPGGLLALTTNLRAHMWTFYSAYRDTLREMGRADLLPLLETHIEHRMTVAETRALLTGAGFTMREVHEQTFALRYLDGSAFLHHAFIRSAFMEAWRAFLPPDVDQHALFARLEAALNRVAAEQGELRIMIPAAYVLAER